MRSFARCVVLMLAASTFAAGFGVAQEPKGRLRVGVINYGQIYASYDKAKEIKKSLEAAMKPLKDDAERTKAGMRDVQAMLENPAVTPADAARFRAQLKSGAEKLVEIERLAKDEVMNKQEKILVQLWAEVRDIVSEHANKRDFDLVLAYGDPAAANPDTLANINRKMGVMDMGAAVPIFVRNGVDITNEVLSDLNQRYRKSKGQPLTP